MEEKVSKPEGRHIDAFYVIEFLFIVIILFVAMYSVIGEIVLPSDGLNGDMRFETFDGKWMRIVDGEEKEEITFPVALDVDRNEEVVLKTTLPEIIEPDDCLCIKSSKQDMRIYIDGELRKEYTTKDTRAFGKVSAAVYVFVKLAPEDAGKTLIMESSTDSAYTGLYYPVYIGNELGIWYNLLKDAKLEVIVAILMFALGLISAIGGVLLNVVWKKDTEIHFLGLGILLAAVWIITNSPLRQLMFDNISVANDIPFFAVMVLPMPFVLYMNSIQKNRYRKLYLYACVVNIIEFIICTILHVNRMVDFTDTVSYMTGLAVAIIGTIGITVGLDIKKKKIKDYYLVIIGVAGAFFTACVEIVLYFQRSIKFSGVVLAVGLVFLLIMAVINTVRNILIIERKKQEAEFASEAKARFLANMSHEIRTPINAVLGMNAMILRESNEPNIRDYALDIQGASQSLLSLINDILDFSKIESGKMELIEAEYDVSSVINDISNMIRIKAEDKNLKLNINIDKKLPSRLFGDEVRIRQVLINLLNNAVKYTEKGGIYLNISGLEFEEKEAEKYVSIDFSVEDTGIGIKDEDIGKLFEEFERIEEEKNRNIEGTGLGMSITVQLLNLMGTKLSVESEYGKGSKFSFNLKQRVISDKPIGDIAGRIRQQADNEKYQASFVAPEANVLVVDDNAVNRKVFRNLLKQTGIQIMECASGQECLEIIKEKHFHIIFLDHMMPEMDGIETLHHMKNDTNHKCNDSYIVALTANAISGAKQMYLDEGFDSYLSKPINTDKLEALIKKVLPQELVSYETLEKQQSDNTVENEKNVEITREGNESQESVLPDIPEIDWTYAKIHISDEELLLDTMRDFYHSMKAEGDYLKSRYDEIFTDLEEINEEALGLFRIKVHSMKSSSALLGMNALSGVAKMLEFAARDKKIDIVRNVTEPFLEEWDKYHEILSGYFESEPVDEEEKEDMDSSVVMAYLSMLKMAMQEMDVDKADEIIENLDKIKFEPEILEKFRQLKAFVMNLDGDSVNSCADEICLILNKS